MILSRTKSLLILALAAAIAGCTVSHEARKTTASAFLGDTGALLQPGGKGEELLVYFNPQADWKQYQKVIVSPVTYWVGQGEKDGLSEANRKALVDYYHAALVDTIGKSYTVVDETQEPEPGTIRLAVALINAKHSWPALATFSTVYPAALAISGLKRGATGKASFVGEVRSEMKATDAATGEVLGAASDKRVGGMSWKGKFDKWETVKNSADHWAEADVYRLCMLQQRDDCPKPKVE